MDDVTLAVLTLSGIAAICLVSAGLFKDKKFDSTAEALQTISTICFAIVCLIIFGIVAKGVQ